MNVPTPFYERILKTNSFLGQGGRTSHLPAAAEANQPTPLLAGGWLPATNDFQRTEDASPPSFFLA